MIDLTSYDYILVAFSGGKDSIACVLTLLEMGVPAWKIELWHHEVDGREGQPLMDWRCTPDYCRKFAAAMGMRIYFSWKVGGFEREMTRFNQPTAQTAFEDITGEVIYVGGKGPNGTRGMFPQVSADLSVRWCSSYLKIDVMASAIRNQDRFSGLRTLVVTGERAEESSARSKYKVFEPNRSDTRHAKSRFARRHVDHYRAVHGLAEVQVWALLEKYRINPHPGYRIGFGRISCLQCIFANKDQAASSRLVAPDEFQRVATYEALSGKTIKRKMSLPMLADQGKPYEMSQADIVAARSPVFDEPIVMEPGTWKLPMGAFGDSCGPT